MKMNFRRTLAAAGAAALAAVSLTACNSDEDGAAGADATGAAAAEKSAVVLEYGAADTLASLGLADRIAGMSTLSGSLPAPLSALQPKIDDGSIADLGGLKEPQLDRIAELDPDVIYIGARTEKMRDELSKLSDDVRLTQATAEDGVSFFDSNRANVETVAKAFGAEDEAAAKLDEIDDLVRDTRERAADAGTALLIMTTGGKVSAYGPESGWYGFLYNDLGFAPAGEIPMEGNHGATLSWEEIAEMNPDHVFVFDRDAAIGKEGESAEQILDNDIFKQTTAAKEGRVHYLEPSNWYLVGGGLDAMRAMVDEIHDTLQ